MYVCCKFENYNQIHVVIWIIWNYRYTFTLETYLDIGLEIWNILVFFHKHSSKFWPNTCLCINLAQQVFFFFLSWVHFRVPSAAYENAWFDCNTMEISNQRSFILKKNFCLQSCILPVFRKLWPRPSTFRSQIFNITTSYHNTYFTLNFTPNLWYHLWLRNFVLSIFGYTWKPWIYVTRKE